MQLDISRFNESAPPGELLAQLRAMSREELMAHFTNDAKSSEEAMRTVTSGIKKLSLLICEFRRREGDEFKPFVELKKLGVRKGTISSAVSCEPIARAFLAGHITPDVWSALRFLDCLEVARVAVPLERLEVVAAARLKAPALSTTYLRAVSGARSPEEAQKWIEKAVKHDLSPAELAASVARGEVVRNTSRGQGVVFGVGNLSLGCGGLFREFTRWIGIQGGVRGVGKWEIERCELFLAEAKEIREFFAMVEKRREELSGEGK